MDISNGFADFVESFNGGIATNSEFVEKLVSEFSELFLVHPKHKLSTGGIVAARFLDVSERPIYR